MKKSILFTAIFSITLSLGLKAQDDPYMTKTFNGSVNDLKAVTSGGNIAVFASQNSGAKVDVYIRANNWKSKLSESEIKERLENYDLSVEQNGSHITALAKPKRNNMNWKNGLSISFKIYVPKTTEADLSTSGGNIEIDGIEADKDFRTSGGNLSLSNLKGKTKGVTSGGNISIKNSSDELQLTTSGGNISAENSDGEMKLTTSGGNISIDDLKGDIDVSTSGGNIRGGDIAGELNAHTSGGNVSLDKLDCSLSAGTSGGNISVTMKGVGKYVKLNNNSGRIHLEIPKNASVDLALSGGKINIPTIENFSGKMEKDKVDGKLNGGGTPINVDAGSGNINLEFN